MAIGALKEALSTVFWFKADLHSFLEHAVSDKSILADIDWQRNYKRASVNQFVDRLAGSQEQFQEDLLRLMLDVATMEDFPHLARAEDSEIKIKEAQVAVQRLRLHIKPYEQLMRERDEVAERIEAARVASQERQAIDQELAVLHDAFLELHGSDDPQERGRLLESLLRDLFKLCDLSPRSAFRIEGEQIDGFFVLEYQHFLLEAKWQSTACERADLDAFEAKVRAKIENTLGLFLSIGGFMESAVTKHSGKTSVMILMDGTDLIAVLENRIDLVELLKRKHRHAADTGEIHFSVGAIGA